MLQGLDVKSAQGAEGEGLHLPNCVGGHRSRSASLKMVEGQQVKACIPEEVEGAKGQGLHRPKT